MVPESAVDDPYEPEPEAADYGLGKDSEGTDSLSRFAGGVAHDFNNLLTVINGYCELALSGITVSTGLGEYLREILNAGNKAAEIVEMILTFSGHQMAPTEIFDGNGYLEEMRALLSDCLGQAYGMDMRLCGEPCPIHGNRRQFRWALIHLITNAKEAMPDGGRIDLETRCIRECVSGTPENKAGVPRFEIVVRDTGQGIPKEILARIFDPYFSTKQCSNLPGRGLGLACTQGILRRFGGGISAESEPGAGTLFRIRLPIAERP